VVFTGDVVNAGIKFSCTIPTDSTGKFNTSINNITSKYLQIVQENLIPGLTTSPVNTYK
jgi:hypothetical protein